MDIEVDFAMIAEAVQIINEQFYILGGAICWWYFSEFPGVTPPLPLVVRLIIPASCADRDISIAIKIINDDGLKVLPEIPITIHTAPLVRPGFPNYLPRIFYLPPIQCEKPDNFRIEIYTEGLLKKSVPFGARLSQT